MNTYSNMKNTGLAWIGDIPSHWQMLRMKNVFQNISEKNHPDAMVLSLYREYGVIPKDSRDDNHNVTSEDTGSYKFVKVNDLVINKMKAWQGSLGISQYEGIVSPAYYVCRFINIDASKRYYHYLLRAKNYAQEFERLSTGMRVGQWDLGIDDFMRVPAILPPLHEQEAIADFLDNQIPQIDSIIEDAKSSIEKYKYWKASMIYEAVTKGIENNASMRQCKIASLEECPTTWQTLRVKNVATVLRGGSPRPIEQYLTDDPDGLNWIKIGDTEKGKKLINSTHQKIKRSGISKTRMVHAGDLLLTNSMSFGEPYILAIDGCIHDGWVCLTDIQKVSKEYLYYFLCSELCKLQFRYQVAGGVVENLNVEKIGSTKILVPPLNDQTLIVNYLNEKCEAIESLIAEKLSLIDDVELYKRALIYEVVTGKRKVV